MQWLFPVHPPMTEALEWQTDVIRTRTLEQRIALRSIPRRTLSLTHRVSPDQYLAARSAIRQSLQVTVPDWAQFERLSDLSAGSGVSLGLDPAAHTLQPGPALLWSGKSRTVSDQVNLSAVGNDIRIDALSESFTAPFIANLLPATATQGASGQHGSRLFHQIDVDLELDDSADIADSEYPQYRGHDVLTDCPRASAGFEEPVAWMIQTFDNLSGRPVHIRQRAYPNAGFEMRWLAVDQRSRAALRRWLYSRRGRQRSFWMPSWSDDFTLSQPIAGSDTIIRMNNPLSLTSLGERPEIDIVIRETDGTDHYRQIVGATFSADFIDLELSQFMGVNLSLSQVERISLLRHVRFNADRIEIEHGSRAEGVSLTVPLLEVPLP